MTERVAIRVDASADMGSGHFMRCLALADGLQRRGARVRFISRGLPAHLQGSVRAHGHEFVSIDGVAQPPDDLAHSAWLGTSQAADAAQTAAAMRDQRWSWLVVDHYALDARWESALRGAAARIFAIDDLADRSHDCDLLLDQNLYADMQTRYAGKVPAAAQLLLGPRHALLRAEFGSLRERAAPRSGPVRRVLIAFGGMDSRNFTACAVAAMSRLAAPHLQVDVVIGASHPRRAEIEATCAAQGYTCHVQTGQMAELMLAADLAIGAGGGLSWERCCLGLPALAICAAQNQRAQVEHQAEAGLLCAPDMGDDLVAGIELHTRALLGNSLLRSAYSRAGMQAVDGHGVRRVCERMIGDSLKVRRALPGDCRNVFEWRNDPSIRAVSQHPAELGWPEHERWFAGVLANPDRFLLIGERDGRPVGVVRFDLDGEECEVSIYLVPGTHAAGTGRALLGVAERWMVAERPALRCIRARVLAGNRRSHGLFVSSGYQAESTCYSKRIRQT